jgi:hypothetical protein
MMRESQRRERGEHKETPKEHQHVLAPELDERAKHLRDFPDEFGLENTIAHCAVPCCWACSGGHVIRLGERQHVHDTLLALVLGHALGSRDIVVVIKRDHDDHVVRAVF